MPTQPRLDHSTTDAAQAAVLVRHGVATFDDALAADPLAREQLLSENGGLWRLPEPANVRTDNASAVKVDAAPPLLIPLPNAMYAGAIGLALVAIFGAAKRLRRKIFA
jgi:hypothetical protein